MVKFSRNKTNKAQAASELAVVGAILIFVIGLIIKTGLTSSHAMNQQLKALRLALLESYKTGELYYSRLPSGARNTASVMVMEDMLSADSGGKFATSDRIPLAVGGSGTFSRNLFLETHWVDKQSLPVFDLFVNGQRFPLTVGSMEEVVLDDSLPECQPFSSGGCGSPGCREFPCWEPHCVRTAVANQAEECYKLMPDDWNGGGGTREWIGTNTTQCGSPPCCVPEYFYNFHGCVVVLNQVSQGEEEFCWGGVMMACVTHPTVTAFVLHIQKTLMKDLTLTLTGLQMFWQQIH